jgi:hypothetical protein
METVNPSLLSKALIVDRRTVATILARSDVMSGEKTWHDGVWVLHCTIHDAAMRPRSLVRSLSFAR